MVTLATRVRGTVTGSPGETQTALGFYCSGSIQSLALSVYLSLSLSLSLSVWVWVYLSESLCSVSLLQWQLQVWYAVKCNAVLQGPGRTGMEGDGGERTWLQAAEEQESAERWNRSPGLWVAMDIAQLGGLDRLGRPDWFARGRQYGDG